MVDSLRKEGMRVGFLWSLFGVSKGKYLDGFSKVSRHFILLEPESHHRMAGIEPSSLGDATIFFLGGG